MTSLSLGYSPCPNDTYIFHALVHGLVPCGDLAFVERLEDVETLNQLALKGALDLTKISFHAFGHLRNRYVLLRSGAALGRGCGPLIVADESLSFEQLRSKTIAIPGRLTTANLLLQLYVGGTDNLLVLPFDQIIPAVCQGRAAAGVIIHESRFTYQQYGLEQLLDLGQWWEEVTGHPIPLGGILAKRSLGEERIRLVDQALRHSIEYARSHPQQATSYIRQHAQELDDSVINQHIDLYVNDYSIDLGEDGLAAISCLLEKAEQVGIIATTDLPLTI
ncbi:1,4-dihydroxy-6-naphthoate synthase [Pelovirga terrestris]|uniref:1,4-dihydroxy-6-naphtoate synthase n=1 Tax=Pelovirga terrestris TaxID=2771352 RepID=A0A8J6QME9_9BACT|nr:1,4-dihydroxy-6-naphthoate synthase [Pelovirga terrestris]MBD1401299.1 1,4-dihydroxy-6-naphthoate synthase [Pelovirga terrestris]